MWLSAAQLGDKFASHGEARNIARVYVPNVRHILVYSFYGEDVAWKLFSQNSDVGENSPESNVKNLVYPTFEAGVRVKTTGVRTKLETRGLLQVLKAIASVQVTLDSLHAALAYIYDRYV